MLTQAVIEHQARRSAVSGNHVFGKSTCRHCTRAKSHLQQAGIDYRYRDVVANPLDMASFYNFSL